MIIRQNHGRVPYRWERECCRRISFCPGEEVLGRRRICAGLSPGQGAAGWFPSAGGALPCRIPHMFFVSFRHEPCSEGEPVHGVCVCQRKYSRNPAVPEPGSRLPEYIHTLKEAFMNHQPRVIPRLLSVLVFSAFFAMTVLAAEEGEAPQPAMYATF